MLALIILKPLLPIHSLTFCGFSYLWLTVA